MPVYDGVGHIHIGTLISQVETAGTYHVWVDSVRGDDVANDGAQATPFASLDAVYAFAPLFLLGSARMQVHLVGDATGVRVYRCNTVWLGGFGPYVAAYAYVAPPMNRVVPTTGLATAALDVTPATEAGHKTTFHFATAAPGWTVHDFQGYGFVRVMRGMALVGRWPISDNTATTIVIDRKDVAAHILASDTVEIVRPAVAICGTDDVNNFASFTIAGSGGLPPAGTGQFLPPLTGHCFTDIELGAPAVGPNLVALNVEGLTFDGCLFTADALFRGGSVGFIDCKGSNAGGSGYNSVFNIAGGTAIALASGVVPLVAAPMGLVLIGQNLVVGEQPGSRCGQFYAPYNVSVYNAPDTTIGAIDVLGTGSFFFVNDDVAVQGTGNTYAAIRCGLGGRAHVSGGAFLTITGTGNPLLVGAQPAVAYGVGAGQFQEVAGFNGNLLDPLGMSLITTQHF